MEDRPLCRFEAHCGSEITALSVCRDLDVVVSMSQGSGVYMHTFSETRVLMHIPLKLGCDLHLSRSGRFAVCSEDTKLQVFGPLGTHFVLSTNIHTHLHLREITHEPTSQQVVSWDVRFVTPS